MPSVFSTIVYLITKYLEFGIVGLLTLFYSTTVSEQVLANSSITFIIISYSIYIAAGYPSGVIKETSILKNEFERYRILGTGIMVAIIIFLMLFVLATCCRVNFYIYIALIIGGANHLKTSVQSVYRVLNMDFQLSLLNVSWALVFLLLYAGGYYSEANFTKYELFFGSWALSALSVSLIFLVYTSHLLLKKIALQDVFDWNAFYIVIKSSFYILIINLCTLILISYDRGLLNYLGKSSAIISRFQFMDTLSNVYYMGITSVLYIHVPNIIRVYSDRTISKQEINSLANKITKMLLICGLIYAGIGYAFLVYIDKYTDAYGVLAGMISLKTTVVIIGLLGTVYMAKSEEKNYSAKFLCALLLNLAFETAYIYASAESNLWLAPFVASISAIIFILFILNDLGSRAFREVAV